MVIKNLKSKIFENPILSSLGCKNLNYFRSLLEILCYIYHKIENLLTPNYVQRNYHSSISYINTYCISQQ